MPLWQLSTENQCSQNENAGVLKQQICRVMMCMYPNLLIFTAISSYSSTLSLKSHKTVKPIYKSDFNNIYCNQTKPVTITI